MANYVESFNSKLDWAMPFQRTGKFPLDRTDLFSSYADAVKYAAGNVDDPDSRGLCGTSYVGQVITVFEADAVKCYIIDPNRDLQEVGSATYGDDKSIVLANGVLALKGFAEAIEAGDFTGKTPRISADGTLEWITPDTSTVDGISQTVAGLTSDVKNLTDNKVDKIEGKGLSTNDYTDEEKSKLAGISAGAQVNVIEAINVNGQAVTPVDKVVDLTIPTKLSDLTNDEGFIDNTVGNLVNYYVKSETYSREEVNSLIGNISTMDIKVVTELPTEDISVKTIYLVAKSDSETNDVYDEYIYVASESKWEMIGNTVIDLSNYLQKTGDASNVTVAFTVAEERSLPATGDALNVIVGKVVKYLSDLATVAFTGSYNDLSDKPQFTVYFISSVLPVGDTSVAITIPDGGHFVDATLRDSTGSQVWTDVEVVNNVVTVSVAESLTYELSVLVSYYK